MQTAEVTPAFDSSVLSFFFALCMVKTKEKVTCFSLRPDGLERIILSRIISKKSLYKFITDINVFIVYEKMYSFIRNIE